MTLSDEEKTIIRSEIATTIIDFVKNPNNCNKTLLLKASQGLGKTITGCKTVLSMKELLTAFLTYEHKQLKGILEDSLLKKYHLFHLKGRDQLDDEGNPLCIAPKYDELQNYNIDISKFLCNEKRCNNFDQCKYLKQFEILNENPQSWAGVHSHLNTGFVNNYMEQNKDSFHFRCLVIDENPISSLNSRLEFTQNDLNKLFDVLGEVAQHIKNNGTPVEKQSLKCFEPLMHILGAFAYLINKTDSNSIEGMQFVNEFIDDLGLGNLDKYHIEKTLNSNNMDVFIEFYRDMLFKRFSSNNKKKYVKDILEDVLQIAKKCIYYHKNKPNEDINLPFYSEIEEIEKKGKTYKRKHIVSMAVYKDLPDVPTIILDATGDADFYKQMFNREVIEYNPSVSIGRNIIQITDGMYYSKSLFYDNTRSRVYNAVYQLVRYHHNRDVGMVNIVTLKKYATIEDEKREYKGKSIERYLRDYSINMNKVRIWHYGDVKGKNEMQNDKVLILVATPEPNVYSFPKEVACWYEGEDKIKTDRIIEPEDSDYFGHNHKYKDKRYFVHIRHKREHEIEQDIERLRYALSSSYKVAYVFSMLPISFKTKKTTIDGLMIDLIAEGKMPYKMVLDVLYEGRGKVSYTIISDKTRYLKPVREAGGTAKLIKDLINDKIIVEVGNSKKRVYQFTDEGKRWYLGIRYQLSKL